jgi:hypothetical protein
MSHWNYRILARKLNDDVSFGLYEVHYDDNDVPRACTKEPTDVVTFISYGDDPLESLKWQLDVMQVALTKPILDYDNFPNVYSKYYRKIKLNKIDELYRKEISK